MTSACTEPAETSTPQTPFEHPTPTPYEPEQEPGVEPTLTTEQVGEVAPELVLIGSEFDADALLLLHNDLLALADADCPNITTQGNATAWNGNCTTAAGATFSGSARLQYRVDEVEGDGIINGFVFATDGSVAIMTAPDGRSLQASIYLDARIADYSGQIVHGVYFSGEIKTDATSAGGNRWMSGAARGSMSRYATADEYGRYYGFGGAFAVDDPTINGAGVTAVSFADFAVADYGCLGVAGALNLRDGQGAWHHAAFAPAEDATPEEGCNACGELSFQQQLLGSFCSAETVFDNLIHWETTPW